MVLADWNDKALGVNLTLTTLQKYEGNKSLKIHVSAFNQQAIKILTQSETDAPKSVTVDFWYRSGSDHGYCGHFMRYQDVNNYYLITLLQNVDNAIMYFSLMEAGVFSQGSANAIAGIVRNTWHNFKIEFCAISSIVYATMYRKEAGEWVEKATQALSPEKFTGGGGYGVGYHSVTYRHVDAYLDLTKVYY